jgi:NADH-quinone oxidoreductase subunit I
MNCGFCAEFCPFDAIKMDHDYELASYDRTTAHIYDKAKLSKPLSYWQTIAPTRAEQERIEREDKEAAKSAKE